MVVTLASKAVTLAMRLVCLDGKPLNVNFQCSHTGKGFFCLLRTNGEERLGS